MTTVCLSFSIFALFTIWFTACEHLITNQKLSLAINCRSRLSISVFRKTSLNQDDDEDEVDVGSRFDVGLVDGRFRQRSGQAGSSWKALDDTAWPADSVSYLLRVSKPGRRLCQVTYNISVFFKRSFLISNFHARNYQLSFCAIYVCIAFHLLDSMSNLTDYNYGSSKMFFVF